MDTKVWGKSSWSMLFFVAAGYELNTEPHHIKDPHYYNFFKEVGFVLGCRYCRDSYKIFFEELDIKKYFHEKCGLMRFVYELKEKVNNKLKTQEYEAAIEQYGELKQHEAFLSKQQIATKLREISKIFYTKDTPPFKEVVDEYMKHQAQCSSKMKTCRKGALGSDPTPIVPITVPDVRPENITDTMYYKGVTGGKKKSVTMRKTIRKSRRKSIRRKSIKKPVSRRKSRVRK